MTSTVGQAAEKGAMIDAGGVNTLPVEVSWNMVRLLPDADLSVFARCGHWTQIERSNDFNACFAHFLES